jgi:transcription initiation factor TFIIIB Brf1 subunit/transcription initiation factor TFIIB
VAASYKEKVEKGRHRGWGYEEEAAAAAAAAAVCMTGRIARTLTNSCTQDN